MIHSSDRVHQNEDIEAMLFHLLHQLRTINRLYAVKVDAEINENYTRIVSRLHENNDEDSYLTNKLPI